MERHYTVGHDAGSSFDRFTPAETPSILRRWKVLRPALAVIFLSGRNDADESGYVAAAGAMERAAAACDGYLGMDSVHGADGGGITISYWRVDAVVALAWRADADHAVVRESGGARWYDWYRMIVTTVDRAYDRVRP